MPKRGDVREDGFVFWLLDSKKVERWYPREEYERKLANADAYQRKRRAAKKAEFEKIKRTLKRGEVRPDGKIFWGYYQGFKNFEYWVTPERYKHLMERRKKPEARKQINAHKRKRYKTDPAYKAITNCRGRIKSRIRMYIKSGAILRKRVPKFDCGCSREELVKHLESQFKPGMTWENHGKWEIDHIKPLAAFDMTNPKEVLAAMHYSNLQPLWAKENRQKSAKYSEN